MTAGHVLCCLRSWAIQPGFLPLKAYSGGPVRGGYPKVNYFALISSKGGSFLAVYAIFWKILEALSKTYSI